MRDLDARFDVIALLWPVIGVGGALVLASAAALLRRLPIGVASASWLVATFVVVVLPWAPAGGRKPVDPIRIVAANTFFANTTPPAVTAASLSIQRPDVLVISEIGLALDQALTSRYPYRILESDVAVYSKHPLRQLPLLAPNPTGIRAEVDGRFVLYAFHLAKPSPWTSASEVGFRTHRRIVNQIATAVAGEAQPVVVAGDLNLVDRSSGYRRLTAGLDDAMRAGWRGPTSKRRLTRPLLARIDHVLMSESWCSDQSRRFDVHGSDHRGVAVDVGPCAIASSRS